MEAHTRSQRYPSHDRGKEENDHGSVWMSMRVDLTAIFGSEVKTFFGVGSADLL